MRLWADKAERGSAWLIQIIAWLARKTGRPFCRALLFPIVFYFMLTDRTARRASSEFLQEVWGRPVLWREVFAHIYSFAATLLDRVYMAAGQFDRFEITISGLPFVDQALRSGKGCMLLGSHLGNFDLMMLAHRATDKRAIHVIMQVDPRSRLRRIAGIEDSALNIIRLGRYDSLLRAHDALAQGCIVAGLADRINNTSHLPVRFMGRMTAMPVWPHVLAARSGAPVLMCFGLYEGGNRYRIEFVEFGPAAPAASRGDGLQPVVNRYAELLEHYARRYPLNWFNFFPYWAQVDDRA